ncbi:4-hydroxybenzoate octaprenyltransferase [Candidatus Berkiella aquae]|uniref:4-hydroxybenzoate octaprenyltransferase n=1 Tax=Candidatus Berkiella aquae TaxID=295108 RepID=A0A0Q9YK57_9GAMM|nr:4-hydroxybenzoate octaprenyltransferase [Candidatus Berkiella aquae]MCS5710070.1 4-hydroxybenzoate octaprenyltransferase [Candidatus Berkiella aquae]
MAILSHLTQRLYQYALLMRLHRPIGTLLLLWPTLIAIWMATQGTPPLPLVLIFVAGVIVMRAAGCVINDFADKDFDGHVSRTKARPIVSKQVSSREALILFLVLLLLAFGLVLLTNTMTVRLSFVALLLATAYPFMKRYTHFPQVILGAAFGFAIPMAYSAIDHSLSTDCWLLYAAAILWAIAYDTLYAMVDKEDDLKVGIKSTAIAFGRYDKQAVLGCHLLMMCLMMILGWQTERGIYYFLGIVFALGFVFYQQWLIKNREKDACFNAFLNNQWVGAALFAGTVFDFYL